MRRHPHRSAVASIPIALLAAVAVAASVNAASVQWATPVQLGDHQSSYLSDAAFANDDSAVVWEEYGKGAGRAVVARTSGDEGASFGAALRVGRANDGRVALCGKTAYVVYVHALTNDRVVVEMATNSPGSASFAIQTVAGGNGVRYSPDVACSFGRVFVSWYEADGDNARLYFASALVEDLVFGAATLVAVDQGGYGYGFRIASSDDSFYATYALESDAQVYLRRWSISSGPGYRLSAHSTTQTVATGDNRHPSAAPEIAVEDSTVAIAYTKCAGIKTKVSHDRGQTWVSEVIESTACHYVVEGGSGPDSVEINMGTIVLTWSVDGIPNYQESFVSISDNDFRTFTRDSLGNHRTDHVGYLGTGSGWKLADAFSNSDSLVKFRLQN